MTVALAALAVVTGALGALGFYLASPNQRLIVERLPLRIGLGIGVAGLLLSLIAFLQITGTATAVFLLFTLVMFLWSVLPLVVGWWLYRRTLNS